jgi:hypothetical protein
MARLRATALAARSVLDGREHDGMLGRVGEPINTHTNRTIKKGERQTIKKRDHAQFHYAYRRTKRWRSPNWSSAPATTTA